MTLFLQVQPLQDTACSGAATPLTLQPFLRIKPPTLAGASAVERLPWLQRGLDGVSYGGAGSLQPLQVCDVRRCVRHVIQCVTCARRV